MPHRGLESTSMHMLPAYCIYMAHQICKSSRPQEQPVTNSTPRKSQRNQQICERYAAGETLAQLAAAYGISEQRVHQDRPRQAETPLLW